jgi:hypothetical protein
MPGGLPTVLAGERKGDRYACTSPGGVRSSGLAGTTAEVSSWAGHPGVAIYFGSIALVHALLRCYVVVTALHTEKLAQRKAALEVLKLLTGATVFTEKAKQSRKVQS